MRAGGYSSFCSALVEMENYGAVANKDWDGEVVSSFQGAFGPPTRGHYEAMKMAAIQHLIDFPNAIKITILWMPTASGSAKKHLALTQVERFNALQVFSDMLMEELGRERDVSKLTIKPSDIEYQLFQAIKNTATIFTLKKLKEIYPKARLTVTMGLDNLFELPYWLESITYPDYAKDIYVTKRTITPEDIKKTTEVEHEGMKLRFVTIPPYGKGTIDLFKPTLGQFRFHMLDKPLGTSSSLLRVALIKYYGRPEVPANTDKTKGPEHSWSWDEVEHDSKYKKAVEFLEGRTITEESDPWYACHIKACHLELPTKIDSFDSDFRKEFPIELYGNIIPLLLLTNRGGSRSSRRSKNRNNRKQKTRSNRKQNNRKQKTRNNRRSRNRRSRNSRN